MMPSRFIVAALCATLLSFVAPPSTQAQLLPAVNTAFFGTWCAQGNPSTQASIVSFGGGVGATNELGLTSSVLPTGTSGRSIWVVTWLVKGTLSPDNRRINWSNGNFWNRCGRDNWGPGWTPGYMPGNMPVGTLSGRWYSQGRRSQVCHVTQQYGSLTFRNQQGVVAQGSFLGRRHFVANWAGTPITGTLRADGTRIDWSNGTYWTRRNAYY